MSSDRLGYSALYHWRLGSLTSLLFPSSRRMAGNPDDERALKLPSLATTLNPPFPTPFPAYAQGTPTGVTYPQTALPPFYSQPQYTPAPFASGSAVPSYYNSFPQPLNSPVFGSAAPAPGLPSPAIAQPGPSSLGASTPDATTTVKKPAKKRKSAAAGVEEEGEEGEEAKKKRIKTPRACESPTFLAAFPRRLADAVVVPRRRWMQGQEDCGLVLSPWVPSELTFGVLTAVRCDRGVGPSLVRSLPFSWD